MKQLNFLIGYDKDEKKDINLIVTEEQRQFWDKNYKKLPSPAKTPNYAKVENFFLNLDYTKVLAYKEYWQEISPKNDSEAFQRWLFAFMSVHTSWKSNIAGYLAIKDWWNWVNRPDELIDRLEKSRVGLQHNRLKYINIFTNAFWQNPSNYKKSHNESWESLRNRIKEVVVGLGFAKTSFALEMCYPTRAKITCLDTHMFQAYGLDQIKDIKHYKTIEQHWVDMCGMWNIPAYIARCLYWDTKQGYNDSRYWSHVLEK
jgi:hypothetical protein